MRGRGELLLRTTCSVKINMFDFEVLGPQVDKLVCFIFMALRICYHSVWWDCTVQPELNKKDQGQALTRKFPFSIPPQELLIRKLRGGLCSRSRFFSLKLCTQVSWAMAIFAPARADFLSFDLNTAEVELESN